MKVGRPLGRGVIGMVGSGRREDYKAVSGRVPDNQRNLNINRVMYVIVNEVMKIVLVIVEEVGVRGEEEGESKENLIGLGEIEMNQVEGLDFFFLLLGALFSVITFHPFLDLYEVVNAIS